MLQSWIVAPQAGDIMIEWGRATEQLSFERLYSFAEITEDFVNSSMVRRGYVAPYLCNGRLWIRIGPRMADRRGEIRSECGQRSEYLLIRGPQSGVSYRRKHHLEDAQCAFDLI
jgi:hypothetical protein